MDGLEIERVGEHEFESGLLAGVRQPIPAEQAFAAHRHVVTPWGDFLEEELEIVVLDVHVQQLVALAVHHADIHLARMEIDSAVILACRSVVFHLLISSHLLVVLEGIMGSAPTAPAFQGQFNPSFKTRA